MIDVISKLYHPWYDEKSFASSEFIGASMIGVRTEIIMMLKDLLSASFCPVY